MRILILGGSTEASALAAALAGRPALSATLSLAGRTSRPATSPVPSRVGGFGGVAGLTAYLDAEAVAAVIDATHPFASRISANAVAACATRRVPLARFTRPPWTPGAVDDWRCVPDLDAAAAALGLDRRTVFLTTGRLGLAAFRRAPQHRYLVRSIDPPALEDRPPDCEVMLGRGPFDQAAEEALMRTRGVDVLVSKNSGGVAGRAKLAAAATLGLPVVMVERPPCDDSIGAFHDLSEVMHWIEAQGSAP